MKTIVVVVALTIAASVAVVVRNWERTRRVEIRLILEPVRWIEPIGPEEHGPAA